MSGRDEEFTEYVSGRMPGLRRLAYLLSGDWDQADDVVQATITNLYVKWRRVRAADNLDAYVRTMLVRTFLGERRKGWRSRVWVTAEVPEQAVAGADADDAMDVRQALGVVPPQQRAALVLRYYCDLSIEQAADVLGCSTGNIKSQTSRGLAALRRALAPQVAVRSNGGEA